MVVKTKGKKKAPVYRTDAGQLIKNKHGRLTAIGKAFILKLAMDGIADLREPVAIIKELMDKCGLIRDNAQVEYERAETEFKIRYTPYSREQMDSAVQTALKDVLTDKSATPSARVSAAKEFKKLYDDEDFGDDDESRCRHYESLWSRKIQAAGKISTEALVEIRDYVASIDFDLFAISEREVEIIEEKAGIGNDGES
jgi:hypothetical protein